MPLSVRVQRFEEVEAEWERMLPRCPTDTVFVTPWWQSAWWRCFGDGYDLRILRVTDGEAVVGLAPMVLRDGILGFLGDTDLFDYHDFLVPRGNEELFFTAFLDYLAATDWTAVEMRSVPQDSPTIGSLPPIAERHGYAVEVAKEDVSPVAPLPGTWDEYLAGLRKKDRHELRRKLRRLDQTGDYRQYLCDTTDDLRPCMDDFFRLHRLSSPEKAAFWNAGRERFFVEVSKELAARDRLKLAVLEIDGIRVATSLSIDYGDAYLLYNSGYDPTYSRLSVGLLNKALAVKGAIASGKQSFDFLRGGERYKYNLGASDRWVYRLTIRR